MPFDLKAFLATAIPAGISAVGAIAGKNAKSTGNAQSRQEIEAAYQEALGAYNTAHGRATDINNWMLQSSFAPLNFGFQQGRADLQNALLMGQQGLAGGQSQIADILGPYTSAGKRGAEETNFLLYGNRPGSGSPTAPSTPGAPAPNPAVFNLPANQGGFNIAAPPSGPAAPGGGGGNSASNMLTSFAPHLADNSVKKSGAQNLLSAFGGVTGAAGGMIPGLAAGPAGLAASFAAPLLGSLVGHLTRRGREKEASSEGVNEHSNWFWNEVVPTAQREGWTGDQLKQVADSGFGDYSNWINQTMGDKDQAAKTLSSQKQYFDAGLKSNPYTSQFYK